MLLDGHGGDETIGYGYNRLNELAGAGQWKTLWHELRLLERNGFGGDDSVSSLNTMRLYLWALWPPARMARRMAAGIARRLNRRAQHQNQNIGHNEVEAEIDKEALIDAKFAQRIDTAHLREAWQSQQPRANCGDREINERVLADALQPLALETLDKAAAANGTEARYPLWDKRLVEFCLSLPAEQKLRDGWSRLIIRRALEGVLPQEVQWRTSKNNFAEELRRGLRVYEKARLEALVVEETLPVKSYVNKTNLASFIEKTLGDAPHNECHAHEVLRAVCLQVWLLQTEHRTLNGVSDSNNKKNQQKVETVTA